MHVPPERRPIGVMFQDLLLFPHLSAIDNVAFPIRARGGARRRPASERPTSWTASALPLAPRLDRVTSRAARRSGSRSHAR